MTALSFMLVEEATKMLNVVRNDRSEFRTKSDKADFEKMPYEQHDAGFFVVYMKKVGSGVKATNKKRADKLMSQLTTSQHDGMVMMSTFCTFDRVYKLMNDCCAVLCLIRHLLGLAHQQIYRYWRRTRQTTEVEMKDKKTPRLGSGAF